MSAMQRAVLMHVMAVNRAIRYEYYPEYRLGVESRIDWKRRVMNWLIHFA